MKRYVVGLMFNEDRSMVLLIKKNRPEWQNKKLNGVGGEVGLEERLVEAMRREFSEETGVLTEEKDWRYFARKCFTGHDICNFDFHFFVASKKCNPTSLTDERVLWVQVSTISHVSNLLPDLLYLIPMALCKDQPFAQIEDSHE